MPQIIFRILHLQLLGLVVQWLEQWTHNPLVAGSNPAGPTTSRSARERLFLARF